VHLPYVETVPAVPTGCFVARSKLRYLTVPTADGRLIDLGTFCSKCAETTLPAAPEGSFSQHGRRTLTAGPEARASAC
jgi:hypothetical protein